MNKYDLSLPTKPIKAELSEPERLIIIAAVKIGKTTSTALLPNALVMNFEDQKQTTTGMIKYLSSYEHLKLLCAEIKEKGIKYDFGVIDTITKLEEFAKDEAERLYRSRSVGKNWINYIDKTGKVVYKHVPGETRLNPLCGKMQYKNILDLPNGSGYPYLTEAMKNIDNLLKSTFPKLIYIAHIKETNYKDLDTGLDASCKDVNLTGKNKYIFSADAHAIGYMHRVNNDLYMSFKPSDDIVSGCKIDRLDGKDFLISRKKDDGTIETFWEQIYISLKEKNSNK